MDNQQRPDEQGISRMRPNRQLTVLFICFFIALVFWLLLALSSQYQTIITFPVAYTNLPARKVVMNELPSTVAVQLRTSGFRIISYDLQSKRDTVTIDVASGLSNSATIPGALVVPTRYFLQDFTRQLGEDVTVTGFRPDSVVLLFNERVSKKVLVRPDLVISLSRQYDTVGSPIAIPDCVTVSGPPAVIEALNELSTEQLQLDNLRQSVLKSLKLKVPPLVSVTTQEVKISVPVEQFTEGKAEVPVRISNVPSGYMLKIFPEKARIFYQTPLSRYNEVSSDMFEVTVDASGLPSADITVLPLRLARTPQQARNFILDPSEVEFILRKK